MTLARVLFLLLTSACLTLPAAGQSITGCLDTSTGKLYNVTTGTSPADACKRGDQELSWTQRGETGPQGPPGPPCAGEPLYEFEGFAPVFLDGDAGGMTMSNFCHDNFPGSRMCTTEEMIRSGEIPEGSVVAAWVRPTIVGVTDGRAVDITGLQATDAGSLSCVNWSTDSGSVLGTSVLRDGGTARIRLRSCANSYNVACCGPPSEAHRDER